LVVSGTESNNNNRKNRDDRSFTRRPCMHGLTYVNSLTFTCIRYYIYCNLSSKVYY